MSASIDKIPCMEQCEMRANFFSEDGKGIPSVTEDEMREVDRIAVQDFQLSVLQMMENAGRNLASHVIDVFGGAAGIITILAGSGGNGGGGLCCARHLHNRGFKVQLLLTRHPEALEGAAGAQYAILSSAGIVAVGLEDSERVISEATVVIDALIGYSLQGAPRGNTALLIEACNQWAKNVVALDIPSGIDATTGESPGISIRADRTVTLALPKRGLDPSRYDLYLTDIGIPPEVYLPLGITLTPFFADHFLLKLITREDN
ncbi:MAG: NAD(P)H-hydrate epimerase [Anaerolineales bacterium]|nr:MAG: NAD(P)H-hydrate epimerase [Anaerolineales bacterium]